MKTKIEKQMKKIFIYVVTVCMLTGSGFWLSSGKVFAALADAEIFTDGELQTTTTDNGDNTYDVSLTYTGSTLNTNLTGADKQVVFYSEDLTADLLSTNGDASVNVKLKPITTADLTVGVLLADLKVQLAGYIDSMQTYILDDPILGPMVDYGGLDVLRAGLDNLNNLDTTLATISEFTGLVPYTINADGTITVDLNGNLGAFLETSVLDTVIEVFEDIQYELGVNSLDLLPEFDTTENQELLWGTYSSKVNPFSTPMVDTLGFLAQQLVFVTPDIVSDVVSLQALGDTTISLNVTVTEPLVGHTTMYATAVQDASTLADLSVLSESSASDDVIFFDDIAPLPPTAEITGNETDGYDVIGEAEADSIITIYDGENNVIATGTTEADGTYTIHLDPTLVEPEEVLGVSATDALDNESTPLTLASVPAIAVAPVDPAAPGDTNSSSPSTGDTMNTNILIATMLGMIGVIVVLLKSKKEHE